jgi:PhzF family phenazine biosynthesis protein
VLNVFAESTFAGNPLAVIEDARDLDDAQLHAICEQFNLSETTFVSPSTRGAARVRIFAPGEEMAFAGHPTLGTAHVVRELLGLGDAFELELNVGLIAVRAAGDRWELRSARAHAQPAGASDAELAVMLGAPADAVLSGARWMSCGTSQLVTPVASVEALRALKPRLELLERHARNPNGRVAAYAVARTPSGFEVRYFWAARGELREDPGTGSACANLGGWLNDRGEPVPFAAKVEQGRHTGRPCALALRIDEAREVYVGGRVVPLMRGELSLP